MCVCGCVCVVGVVGGCVGVCEWRVRVTVVVSGWLASGRRGVVSGGSDSYMMMVDEYARE